MAELDAEILRWIVEVAVPGTSVTQTKGLREGGSPYLITLGGPDRRELVLRLGDRASLELFRTEVGALELPDHHVPKPQLVAADLDGAIRPDVLAVLTTCLPGTSRMTSEPSPLRLRTLGSVIASIHRTSVPPSVALPRRRRPISGVDFDALRRSSPARPLLVEAERVLAALPEPSAPEVFVHGDFWQGNTMWEGDTLTGVVDWDCAGVGHAGVDLGSLRCDAALSSSLEAADEALAGYESAIGEPAADVAYWDVVAALSTPPTMSWFVDSIQGQGRVDLDQSTLLARRDAFLGSALTRLG